MTILFAGDPHRNFKPIIRACLAREPGTLVLLGDLDCPLPLREALAPVIAASWRVRWILGNHDCETETAYDNLVGDDPDGDLGYQVSEFDGVRSPACQACSNPRCGIHAGRMARTRSTHRAFEIARRFWRSNRAARVWRGGLPLWHRDSIFPDDVARLADQRFDVLVTHEAPSSHRHGFTAIDDLAAAGGARLIVHGHHHNSYSATLPNGIAVRGLGLAEAWPLGPIG